MSEELPPITLPNEAAICRLLKRSPPTFACLVRFVRQEGTRATETARIEWSDIRFDPSDPDQATCLLRHTKGSEPRVIELAPRDRGDAPEHEAEQPLALCLLQ